MKGRIILSQADFSANNIGRYVELSDLTKKVLMKQTQYGEGSTEAVALNAFLNALTTEGFIGGESPLLKSLIIPGLASEHDELLYDIAQLDGNGYPTDIMSAEEKAATDDKKVYKTAMSGEKIIGLTRYADTNYDEQTAITQSKFIVPLFTTNGNMPSFSCVFYKIGTGGIAAGTTYNHYSSHQIGFKWNSLDIYNAGVIKAKAPINNFNDGFYGVSYVSGTGFEGLFDSGATVGETTFTDGYVPAVVLPNSNSMSFGRFTYGSNLTGIIAIGNYINTTKMATLKTLVDTLMVALHV